MLYRNKITGVEVDVSSEISGGWWEPVSSPVPGKTKETERVKKSTKGKKRG